MSLPPLFGHAETALAAARAITGGRLPRTLLVHGARGVGKQRLALWMGQLLLCDDPSDDGPCGRCRNCGMADRLEHPDLLWYFPVKRPPSKGSRERDQEALEMLRIESIVERRDAPLVPSYSSEPLGLHLGTVRNLRREAGKGPALAARRVFVIANAEELVSQEASPEAANALLKVLEEPPRATWLLLTSSEPGRLLPTIRSRTTGIYLAPLSEPEVRTFLVEHAGATPEQAERTARLSGGSIGRALGLLPDAEEEIGPLEEVRQQGFHLLRAALEDRPEDRFGQSLEYPPAGGRGMLELLGGLETWLRDFAVLASGTSTPLVNEDARAWLTRSMKERPRHPAAIARSIAHVERARQHAAANVNPQLLVHGLISELQRELTQARGTVTRESS